MFKFKKSYLFIVVVLACEIGVLATSANVKAEENIEISNVKIKNITVNSATVEWKSSLPDISYILYGTENSSNGINHVAKDTNVVTDHRLLISNLATNTKYYFQIQSDSLTSHMIESMVYNFTTTVVSNDQTTQINTNANQLHNNQFEAILAKLKQLRDKIKEQANEIKYLRNLTAGVKGLTQTTKDTINNFITYGVDENTKKLGEGERTAVMYSFKSAFNKLPETEQELADAIKIGNGRWPSARNENAEKKAKKQFEKIYKKIADMNNTNDNAAITVMAYGLRQKAENRSLNSEKAGIKIFNNIYKHNPKTTEEWNAMQAITYSGSSRD